jgi:hypothetical protein
MTSTIVWFLLAANTVVFALLFAISGWIAERLIHDSSYVAALRLMVVNTFPHQPDVRAVSLDAPAQPGDYLQRLRVRKVSRHDDRPHHPRESDSAGG